MFAGMGGVEVTQRAATGVLYVYMLLKGHELLFVIYAPTGHKL